MLGIGFVVVVKAFSVVSNSAVAAVATTKTISTAITTTTVFHLSGLILSLQTITSNGDKEMLEFLLQELELVVLGSDALANAVLKVYGVALIPVNLNTRCDSASVCTKRARSWRA